MAAQASPSTEVAIPEDEPKLQTPWCFWVDLTSLRTAKAAEFEQTFGVAWAAADWRFVTHL